MATGKALGVQSLGRAVIGAVLLAAVSPKAEAATNITETVDLAGQRVVFNEQLTGDGAFVNSSEDQATLVINVTTSEGRSNFSGTISGNIRVELSGSGCFQAFTSPGNSYTGGTRIEQGYLYVATCDDIGTGPLELTRNGRLVMTGTRNAGDYSGTVNRVLTNRVVLVYNANGQLTVNKPGVVDVLVVGGGGCGGKDGRQGSGYFRGLGSGAFFIEPRLCQRDFA